MLKKSIMATCAVTFSLLSHGVLANAQFGYTEDELRQLQKWEQNVAPLSGEETISIEQQTKKSLSFQEQALNLSREWNDKMQPGSLSPVLNINPQENPKSQASGIMVFASLTMPRASLVALLKQSERLHVPLVIRGVLPAGFPATMKAIQDLLNSEQPPINSGFAINPEWFRQFDIQQVPTFVVVKEGHCLPHMPCSASDFDSVSGNISLYRALDILKDGDNGELVKTHLINIGEPQ